MPNVLNFLPNAASPAQLQIRFGKVLAPAPLTASSPLYVCEPDWDPIHRFVVSKGHWSAHGASLPTAGMDCLLIGDSRGNLWCVEWGAP